MKKVSIFMLCVAIIATGVRDFFDLIVFIFLLSLIYSINFFIIRSIESYVRRKELENDLELLIQTLNDELNKIPCKQLHTDQLTKE